MTDHFMGINRGKTGADEADWVRGTSTGSTDLELRIADASGWTRNEIYDALHRMAEELVQPRNITATKFPIA